MSRKTFKKQLTSKELIEQINPKNLKLMKSFLKEKNARSSDATIYNYESDLLIFFCWNVLYNDNKFFVDIKKLEFAEFFSFAVDELKWNSARFSRVRSVLSGLSIFIEKFLDTDYPNYRNVILKVIENLPKDFAREKTVLKDEQINDVFEKLQEQGEYQIACWLALAVSSGSRFSEILRFTTDMIDENCLAYDGIFLETTKSIRTKGRGKNGKSLKKYIVKDLFWKHYTKWLEIRQEVMNKNGKTHNSIFIRDDGEPASESVVRGWIEKIENILKVPFYPHALRHFYTSYLIRSGLPHDLIKDIVGWAGIGMVDVYNDVSSKDRVWPELNKFKDDLNKSVIL